MFIWLPNQIIVRSIDLFLFQSQVIPLLTVVSIVSPGDQLTSVFVLDTSNPTPSAQWVLTVTIVRRGTTIWEGSTIFDPTQYRKLSHILQNPLGSSQINSINCSIATCVQICECSLLPLDSFDSEFNILRPCQRSKFKTGQSGTGVTQSGVILSLRLKLLEAPGVIRKFYSLLLITRWACAYKRQDISE